MLQMLLQKAKIPGNRDQPLDGFPGDRTVLVNIFTFCIFAQGRDRVVAA